MQLFPFLSVYPYKELPTCLRTFFKNSGGICGLLASASRGPSTFCPTGGQRLLWIKTNCLLLHYGLCQQFFRQSDNSLRGLLQPLLFLRKILAITTFSSTVDIRIEKVTIPRVCKAHHFYPVLGWLVRHVHHEAASTPERDQCFVNARKRTNGIIVLTVFHERFEEF